MSGEQFSAAEARSGRVIVGRLLPGADLIRGLEAVCKEHGVRYAAVNFAYGSLSRASFKRLTIPKGQSRPVLTPMKLDKRVEFLAGQGLVCDGSDGGRDTHLHGCVSDETGQVVGGHFVPGENPIYNNLDFTLQELIGVRLTRRFDDATQTVEMDVEQLESAAP
jgi:predicted DNA-binding protein with PD1-like motif